MWDLWILVFDTLTYCLIIAFFCQSWLPEHLNKTTVRVLPRSKLIILSAFNVPASVSATSLSTSQNLKMFRRFTCWSVSLAQNKPTPGVGRTQQNSTYQVLKVPMIQSFFWMKISWFYPCLPCGWLCPTRLLDRVSSCPINISWDITDTSLISSKVVLGAFVLHSFTGYAGEECCAIPHPAEMPDISWIETIADRFLAVRYLLLI